MLKDIIMYEMEEEFKLTGSNAGSMDNRKKQNWIRVPARIQDNLMVI